MNDLLSFLYNSPTAFQAVDNIAALLKENGFQEYSENETVAFKKGGKYFTTRNQSSILAFKVGKDLKDANFHIAASHSDCPGFKLKPNSLKAGPHGVFAQLNTEVYGGALLAPWFDRPLSLAGRLILRTEKGVESRLFDMKKNFCMIPSLAIHMNREANKGYSYNPQKDLLPIVAMEKDFDLNAYLVREAGIEKDQLLGYDLYLYPRQEPVVWGAEDEFFASHHIDNLECAYTTLKAFLEADKKTNINVYACFDNEEVGSLTRQGADSDFLVRNLEKVANGLGLSYPEILAGSMMLSCDNAHSAHPNYPEKDDPTNHVIMNKGIVIKYNANQSYTSDALSSAVFRLICDKVKVPYQFYTNRSDIRGGSTLGNLSNAQVSLLSLDIGCAQLAMHSCYESAGMKDVQYMIDGVRAYYNTHVSLTKDGSYHLS
ncbi:MAG: M18 family aminopeptidase [Erysipelotrichaceae bacterium]|nr:M18 family aminopeptidase [Erysipelotrichaceae bacterium]